MQWDTRALLIIAGIAAPIIAGMLSGILQITGENASATGMAIIGSATSDKVILIYSPRCSHCHALLKYLAKKYPDLNIHKTTDKSVAQPYLKKTGVEWSGGVPLMIFVTNEKTYFLLGFPNEFQLKDGYYLGKKQEESFCKQIGGTPYYENGTYLFCIRKGGLIMGNEHAVDWLMKKVS